MVIKSLAVFGDELFLGVGQELSSKKREEAVYMVTELFKHLKPELIYIMPTKGTNTLIPPICNELDIPYIIVAPYKSFYDEIPNEISDNEALQKCKSFIVVSDSDPQTTKERMDLLEETTVFCANTAMATLFVHSHHPSLKFVNFMNDIIEKENIRSWELVY